MGTCYTHINKSITPQVCGLCQQCSGGTCSNIPQSSNPLISDPFHECSYSTCDGTGNCYNLCENAIPYGDRIGFDESPRTYYVPNLGNIPYVCSDNTINAEVRPVYTYDANGVRKIIDQTTVQHWTGSNNPETNYPDTSGHSQATKSYPMCFKDTYSLHRYCYSINGQYIYGPYSKEEYTGGCYDIAANNEILTGKNFIVKNVTCSKDGNNVVSVPPNIEVNTMTSDVLGNAITITTHADLSTAETLTLPNPLPPSDVNSQPYMVYETQYAICNDNTNVIRYCNNMPDALTTYNSLTTVSSDKCFNIQTGKLQQSLTQVSSVTCTKNSSGNTFSETVTNPRKGKITEPTYQALGTDSTDNPNNPNNLPACATPASAEKICASKGYANYTYTISTGNRYCQNWTGVNWNDSIGTLDAMASLTCKPETKSVPLNASGQKIAAKVAFTLQGADYSYGCDATSYDGVCPMNFIGQTCGNDVTKDMDCGNHTFQECLDILDASGNIIPGVTTCNYSKLPANPICGIQSNVIKTPATLNGLLRQHARCKNGSILLGSIVYNSSNGCPVCLPKGASTGYSGVFAPTKWSKSGEQKSTELILTSGAGLVQTREQPALAASSTLVLGKYPSCPTPEYIAVNHSGKIECEPTSNYCDEGFINALPLNCASPLTYDPITKIWSIKPGCLIDGSDADRKYSQYCGLDMYYSDYELYKDRFKIIVK
jgi:hypothetical protein